MPKNRGSRPVASQDTFGKPTKPVNHDEETPNRASIPARFQDQDKFLVFRYNGLLPMAGVRVDDVYHVLWIERQFGELYDHG